jgi:LysR family glycine cleavage system transcriptional activator
MGREFQVADALRDGLLVQLSEQRLAPDADFASYFLVYPPALRDWAPLQALRSWLHDEVRALQSPVTPIVAIGATVDGVAPKKVSTRKKTS